MSAYKYPTSEKKSGDSEKQQDPGKRSREIEVITQSIPVGWKHAIDFGCGVGANFSVLANSFHSHRAKLLGIEPDKERMLEAHKLASSFSSLSIDVRCGDISILENEPNLSNCDFALLCQVIGHTSRHETDRVVRVIGDVVNAGGRGIFLLPFFNSVRHRAKTDFFHCVDLRLSPYDTSFRKKLSPHEFDKMCSFPEKGILPVRAFGIMLYYSCDLNDLPIPIDSTPSVFDASAFSTKTWIYSIHKFTDGGVPLIGDLIVEVNSCD